MAVDVAVGKGVLLGIAVKVSAILVAANSCAVASSCSGLNWPSVQAENKKMKKKGKGKKIDFLHLTCLVIRFLNVCVMVR